MGQFQKCILQGWELWGHETEMELGMMCFVEAPLSVTMLSMEEEAEGPGGLDTVRS